MGAASKHGWGVRRRWVLALFTFLIDDRQWWLKRRGRESWEEAGVERQDRCTDEAKRRRVARLVPVLAERTAKWAKLVARVRFILVGETVPVKEVRAGRF